MISLLISTVFLFLKDNFVAGCIAAIKLLLCHSLVLSVLYSALRMQSSCVSAKNGLLLYRFGNSFRKLKLNSYSSDERIPPQAGRRCHIKISWYQKKIAGTIFSYLRFMIYEFTLLYNGLIHIFLKLIGSLGSPWSCSFMGSGPCAL